MTVALSNGCACECTSRIFDSAVSLKDIVVNEAATCGIELPKCREVLAGDIVHDCEKLAVSMNGVVTGLPLASSPQTPAVNAYAGWGCDPSWTANISVEIVRCGPPLKQNGVSSSEDQEASALVRAQDAFIILKAAKTFAQNSIGAVPVTISFPPRQDFISTLGIFQIAVGETLCSHSGVRTP